MAKYAHRPVTIIANRTSTVDTDESSAVLQVISTSGGFLPPRMTDAQRDAISTPANGLMIFNTDEGKPQYYTNSSWISLHGEVDAGAGITVPDPLQLGNGTVTAPTFGFSSDTNTGIYRVGADQLGITAGGVRVTQFTGVASAVNYFDVTNAATGNPVLLNAAGTDANVSIVVTPKGSGNVRVDSTTGAFMPPRMSTAQRDALTGVAGMVIYNTTLNVAQYYNGTGWVNTREEVLWYAVGDETSAITSGTAKLTFRMPFAMTLTAVRASLSTAQGADGGGGIFTVDVNEAGSTILSTKLTIDNNEKTTATAATAAVISDTALADDAEMTVDVDQVGDGSAKGLKICLIGYRTSI